MTALKIFAIAAIGAMAITAGAQAGYGAVSSSYGADSIAADTAVYDFREVEQKPEYPGGEDAMFAFLGKNIQWPQEIDFCGTVVAQFIIEKDGSISDIKVVTPTNEDFNREVERLVRMMPQWAPGKNGGEPVRVVQRIPVRFKIQY